MMQENMPNEELWKQKKRKRRRLSRTMLAWLLVVLTVVVLLIVAVGILRVIGVQRLRGTAQSNRPKLEMMENQTNETETAEDAEAAAVWKEGWVRHNGKIYEYNDDIFTFLVMGIDVEGAVKESTSATGGGQNDANFLVIVNPDNKTISVLAVNRDTMTEIQMYGMGKNGETIKGYGQLAIQHGYGDGKELSCELTRDAVSALFYDLPIHGYAAINIGIISKLNDAIGGVEVTIQEDLTAFNKEWTEGNVVTLYGEDAVVYVRKRDTTVFESNRGRLARQKQYLTAFADKLKSKVKEDITLPITLYNQLSKYMVTDISVDEVAYLTSELLDYTMAGSTIYTLEGTTQMGEKFEEFYPDKEALKDLMITLFYQEVEN